MTDPLKPAFDDVRERNAGYYSVGLKNMLQKVVEAHRQGNPYTYKKDLFLRGFALGREGLEKHPNEAHSIFSYYSFLLRSLSCFAVPQEMEAQVHTIMDYVIRRAVELDPDNSFYLRAYADHLAYRGDNKAAIEVCNRLLRSNPENPEAFKALGFVCKHLGLSFESLACFWHARTLNPQDGHLQRAFDNALNKLPPGSILDEQKAGAFIESILCAARKSVAGREHGL